MDILKKGSKGNDVKLIQKYLGVLVQDGVFGSLTEEAVKDFQKRNGLSVDGVVGKKTFEALEKKYKSSIAKTNANYAYLKQGDEILVSDMGSYNLVKANRKINRIILHCTATCEGVDYTVSQIKKMHLANGWSDIGYHYIIYRDGTVHLGRDIDKIGAHCTGYNTGSIGIVYVGGCPKETTKKSKDTRTESQKESLKRLVSDLLKLYALTSESVHGHYEYANKACPSFNVDEFKKELK